MSRPLLGFLALAALALLANPATAQNVPAAGGKVEITDLAAHVYTNQTKETVRFHVALTLNQGTCVGGSGQFPVTLTATKASQTGNATVTVQVQPSTIMFQVPQTQTLGGAYSGSGDAVIVVSPGLVRENVTVPITVKASATVQCSVPASQVAPPTLSAEGTTTVHFRPVSDEIANGPTEALPGLGLPAMLAVIVGALLVARRVKA
ncbi:MAG TPA: hypothetical protein VM286_04970 [Candidatus Thermoplasmatota archaeon]|nr:hypothetical protein [Candidatus Thermoplasmatota archaeon]